MACILLVSAEGMMGGAETSLLLLARNLCARFAVAVACPTPSPLSQALTTSGIAVCPLPAPPRASYRSWRGAAYWPRATGSLVHTIRRTKADLVHANTFYAGAVALPAARVTLRRFLVHARDLADFGLLVRLYGRYAHRLIAVSRAVANMLAAGGIPSDKIRIVPNGLELGGPGAEGPHATAGVARAERRAGDFVFAHVGQFVPWKNADVFIRAAARVAPRLPGARFVIVGDDLFQRDGLYKRELYYLARCSPVADRIEFWGWRANMEEVWPALDCLVHTAQREAFGRVIIEAMAHRLPVIAAGCGGPAELVQADRTGVLVPPRDPEALAEAMLRVARDPEWAETIAAAACQHVRSHFAAAQTAARVQEIYDEVLSA